MIAGSGLRTRDGAGGGRGSSTGQGHGHARSRSDPQLSHRRDCDLRQGREGTLLGLSASGWSAPSSPKKIRSPAGALAGGSSGSKTSWEAFEAHISMPCDLMPRMFRGFRLHSTMTERSCKTRVCMRRHIRQGRLQGCRWRS